MKTTPQLSLFEAAQVVPEPKDTGWVGTEQSRCYIVRTRTVVFPPTYTTVAMALLVQKIAKEMYGQQRNRRWLDGRTIVFTDAVDSGD